MVTATAPQSPVEPHRWPSVSQAARQIDVSESLIRVWIARGRLEAVRTSVGWLVSPEALAQRAAEREERRRKKADVS